LSRDGQLVKSVLGREPIPVELPRAEVYRGLVRSNLRAVIRNAFPVTIEVEGDGQFEARIADFLEARGPSTSLYRDIPEDVVQWALESALPLADLMHYEWLELVAARHPADLDTQEAMGSQEVHLNPTLQFGMYQRQVHRLSAQSPEMAIQSAPVIYLVWRRPRTDEIAFHRVGILLARALAHAQVTPGDPESLVDRLLAEEPTLERDAVSKSLTDTLALLRARDGVL
jgi:hypothetical protein